MVFVYGAKAIAIGVLFNAFIREKVSSYYLMETRNKH